jgi:hypothetical protein
MITMRAWGGEQSRIRREDDYEDEELDKDKGATQNKKKRFGWSRHYYKTMSFMPLAL